MNGKIQTQYFTNSAQEVTTPRSRIPPHSEHSQGGPLSSVLTHHAQRITLSPDKLVKLSDNKININQKVQLVQNQHKVLSDNRLSNPFLLNTDQKRPLSPLQPPSCSCQDRPVPSQVWKQPCRCNIFDASNARRQHHSIEQRDSTSSEGSLQNQKTAFFNNLVDEPGEKQIVSNFLASLKSTPHPQPYSHLTELSPTIEVMCNGPNSNTAATSTAALRYTSQNMQRQSFKFAQEDRIMSSIEQGERSYKNQRDSQSSQGFRELKTPAVLARESQVFQPKTKTELADVRSARSSQESLKSSARPDETLTSKKPSMSLTGTFNRQYVISSQGEQPKPPPSQAYSSATSSLKIASSTQVGSFGAIQAAQGSGINCLKKLTNLDKKQPQSRQSFASNLKVKNNKQILPPISTAAGKQSGKGKTLASGGSNGASNSNLFSRKQASNEQVTTKKQFNIQKKDENQSSLRPHSLVKKPKNLVTIGKSQSFNVERPFSKSYQQGGGGGGNPGGGNSQNGIQTSNPSYQPKFQFNPPKQVPVSKNLFTSSGMPTDFFQPQNYYSYSDFVKHMTKYFNLDNPAPYVSARSWIMTNLDTGECLYAKQEKEVRQVASLTKIMTFWVVINICEKLGIDIEKTDVSILTPAALLEGTSARLLAKDKLSINELLYGMMLPSGNDAAQSLAIYFGNYMLQKEKTSSKTQVIDGNIDESQYPMEPLITIDPSSRIDEEQEQQDPLLDYGTGLVSLPEQSAEKEEEEEKSEERPKKNDLRIITVQTAQSTDSAVSGQEASNSNSSSLRHFSMNNNSWQNTPKLTLEGDPNSPTKIPKQASSAKEDEAKSAKSEVEEKKESSPLLKQKPDPDSKLMIKIRQCLEKFYELMNEQARELGLKKTNYASAHGMYNEHNVSTAADSARLCYFAMKNSKFREVVKVTERECMSKSFPGHIYKWSNTNHLLKREPNCTGIKTGVTWAAGPCLAASMKKDNYHICVIVLSCASMDSRWYEVPKLVHWGVKKLQKIKQSNLKPKVKRHIIKSFTYI